MATKKVPKSPRRKSPARVPPPASAVALSPIASALIATGMANGAGSAGVPVPLPGGAGNGTPTATGTPVATGTPAARAGSTGRGRSKGLQTANKLRKPKGNQAILASTVAAEIRRSAAAGEYRGYFGPHAPDPEALATILDQAGGLSLEESQEKQRWITVRDQRNHVWDQAFTTAVDTFHTCFQFALGQNSAIGQKFPTTEVFLGTNSAIGARGAATRKAKKAAAVAAGTSPAAPAAHPAAHPAAAHASTPTSPVPLANPQGPAASADVAPQGPAPGR